MIMILDLSFLDLELDAARTGVISAQLPTHPTFAAIAAHEAELHRPAWDEASFRTRFSAAAGDTAERHDWGLAPCFTGEINWSDRVAG